MPKFGYAVKYNGKYYPANVDIPETAPAEEKPEAPKKATKAGKKGDA